MGLDYAPLTFIATLLLPVVAFLARKRIGRYLFTTFMQFVKDEYFDEEVSKAPDGTKRVLMRPNARGGAFLLAIVPGLIDWAVKNVKIKLPPFQLPENLDLKAIGTNVLAQKALSGKKLKLDDAIPLLLGYGKEWAEKTGILNIFQGGKKPSEASKLPEHLQHASK